jgi:hypothetical protein
MAVIGGTEIVASHGTGGGSGGGVSSVNSLTGAVLFAAGTGITLTPSGNTITIAASGSGSTTIASGNATLPVTAIPANTAGTVVSVSAPGVLASDAIEWAFNAIPGIGYNEGIYVLAFASPGAVNFMQVNGSANAYTPGPAVLNWRVVR